LLADYGYIAILLVTGIAVPALILILARFLSAKPKKIDPVKTDTYECGMHTVGSAWFQFNFRYYFYALLFVVFDVETVFLYPWAVYFRQLKLFGFIEMLIFILILVVGFVYAWKKKVMEWK